MTEAIAARHLRKRYGPVSAVGDVSFSVAEGEVVCLLGPNGAGKSTTVRMLATLTRLDGGTAMVAGHDVTTHPRQVRARIGYVAQQAGTDADLTGRENLLAQAAAQQLRRADAARRATELLELVGLTTAGRRLVRTYSGGMRRRLEIAMGIVHHPRVMFLDEPTTGLDPEARAGLWVELARLAEQQRLSMLLTTHYLEEADRLADRVVIISQGRVVVDGTPTALKADLAGDAVSVELAGRPTDQTVLTAAQRLDARDINIDGSLLRVRVVDGNRALPAILDRLHTAGLSVASAEVVRPSLDDVYLHYTGRNFTIDDRPFEAVTR